MARGVTLTFAYDEETGVWFSRNMRAPSQEAIAYPILNYGKIGEGGDFTKPLEYNLEKISVYYPNLYRGVVKTKKVPLEIKNLHREFWGLKPQNPANPNSLPEKQREVYDLLLQGPMSEEEVAAATSRRKGKALPMLQNLGSKGLAYVNEDDKWYVPQEVRK